MIYAYHCPGCTHEFDVVKSVKEIDLDEHCPQCATRSERRFVPSRVYFTGTKVEHAEYNPGLGCIVRNKDHRAEIAKSKGLEEIGNEPVERIHKHFEKAREEKLEKAYEMPSGWVGDGSS